MNDAHKTKSELIAALNKLRQTVAALQAANGNWQPSDTDHEHHFLRTVIDYLPDYIYAKDTEGRFTLVNEATVRGMGAADPSEILGKTDFDFYPHELAAQYCADEIEVLQTGQALTNHEELVHNLSTHEQRWLLTTKMPLRNAQQETIGIVGISHDITERRHAEIEEREQRSFWETLQDVTALLTSTFDIDEILQRIVDNVSRMVPHDAVNITLFDSSGTGRIVGIRGYEAQGSSEETLRGLRFTLTELPNLAKAAETGQPVLVSDTASDPTWIHYREASWLRSHVNAAIKIKDELIGFINLDSPFPGAFTERHAKRLKLFADHAAIAFENARLYQESRASEAALRDSEERYRRVVEDQTELICRFSPDFIATFANKAYCRFFGQTQEEIVGTSLWSKVPPEELARVEAQFKLLTEANPVRTIENRNLDANGHYHWIQWTDRAVYDASEQIIEYQTVGRDVTERKLALAALEESEARYRGVIEDQTEFIVRFSPDFITTFVNEACCRFFGQTEAELIGTSIWANIPLGDRAPVQALLASLTLAAPVSTSENYNPDANGNLRWVQWTNRALYDPEGTLTGYQSVGRDITERKRIEQAQQESEERYRLISTVSSDYMFSTRFGDDGDVRFEWVAGAFEAINGYTLPEFEAMGGWRATMHPDDRADAARAMTELRANQKVVSEARFFHPNGESRWLRTYAHPRWDAEQNCLVGLYGAVQDITERKRVEQALQESEARYRAVVQDQTDLICRYNPNFETTLANEAYYRFFGQTEAEITGTSLWLTVPIETKAEVEALFLSLTPENPVKNMENHNLDAGGNAHWIQWTDRALYDDEGILIGYQSVGHDITERKQAEAALRESEIRYRIIGELSSDYAYRYDINPDGSMTLAWVTEQSFKRVTGYELSEIGPSFQLYHPDDAERCRQHVEQTMKGEAISGEYRLVTKSGDTRWVYIRRHVDWDEEEGRYVRFYGVAQDITERKHAEQELQRYQDHLEELIAERTAQLETANRELNAFAYSVSHDLRAPLRALNNYSLFLKEDCGGNLDEDCLTYIDGIAESAQHMERLVVDLLEYSRISRVKVVVSHVNVTHLLDTLAARYNLRDHVTLTLPPDAPTIVAKSARLEQIFGNLLTNAVKFRRANAEPEVCVTWADQGNEWSFSVEDNGIGINSQHFEKIFGIFERLHTQEEFEGTGIGLAIVEKAVKEHGGRIWVTSQVGHGSTFTFTIPKDLQED